MPFRWTINPYRGCTHACTYCLVAKRPSSCGMGGRSGSRTFESGTRSTARCARPVPPLLGTEVGTTGRRIKPAYRVTLEDGTELIASGDHRFLTRRGWKHVTGA